MAAVSQPAVPPPTTTTLYSRLSFTDLIAGRFQWSAAITGHAGGWRQGGQGTQGDLAPHLVESGGAGTRGWDYLIAARRSQPTPPSSSRETGLESPWGEDLGALQRALQISQGTYGLRPYLAEYEGSAPPLNVWISDLLDGNEGDETERLVPSDVF